MDDMWKWMVGLLATAWGAITGFLLQRQIKRIDDVEKTKANKESTNDRFDHVLAVIEKQGDIMKEHMDDDRAVHASIQKDIGSININVVRMEEHVRELRRLNGAHD